MDPGRWVSTFGRRSWMKTSLTRIPSVPWSAFTPPFTSTTFPSTFDKDTRRVMILRVEGIDLLDEHATHFDEVTWTSEPSYSDWRPSRCERPQGDQAQFRSETPRWTTPQRVRRQPPLGIERMEGAVSDGSPESIRLIPSPGSPNFGLGVTWITPCSGSTMCSASSYTGECSSAGSR